MEALWIVRQFPKQILRDLDRFHHRRLGDWWRGTRTPDGEQLSSYELLCYLEFMDEDGAFKTQAERGGRWPVTHQMWAETVNEAYRLRNSYQAVNGGADATFDTSVFEFIHPVDRALREKVDTITTSIEADRQARIEAAWGFS